MLRLTLGGLCLCLLVVACGKRVSEAECVKLLDRYTEMLARQENPEATVEQIAKMKDAARVRARHDPTFEFGRCPAVVSRGELECAMAAPSVDTIERCLIF